MRSFYSIVLATSLLSVISTSHGTTEDVTNVDKCTTSVWFALDGSTGLSRKQFQLQKRVLKALLSRISNTTTGASFNAVVYSSVNDVIFPTTSKLSVAFHALAPFSYNPDPVVFIGGSIVACDAILRTETKAAKMVLFSSGLDNLGGEPVARAEVFKERSNGEIIVISIGGDNESVLRNVAGKAGYFLRLEPEWDISFIVNIVQKLCHSSM